MKCGQINSQKRTVSYVVPAKMGSRIDVKKQGCVAISYFRAKGRGGSITHYFDKLSSSPSEIVLPLRILLAKQLVERNCGNMILDHSDTEKRLFEDGVSDCLN